MRNILIVETDTMFRADIEKRKTLGNYDDFDLFYENRPERLMESIDENSITEVVVNTEELGSYPDWDIDVPVTCYARSAEGIKEASNYGIPCFGITGKAVQLLDKIKSGETISISGGSKAKKEPEYDEDDDEEYEVVNTEDVEDVEDVEDIEDMDDDIVKRKTRSAAKKQKEQKNVNKNNKPARTRKPVSAYDNETEDEYGDEEEVPAPVKRTRGAGKKNQQPARRADTARKKQQYKDRYDEEDYEDVADEYEEDEEEDYRSRKGSGKKRSVKNNSSRRNETARKPRYDEYEEDYSEDYDDEDYDDEEYNDGYDESYDDDGYDDDYDEYEEDEYEDEEDDERFNPVNGRGRRKSEPSRKQNSRTSGAEKARTRANERGRRNAEREDRRARREFEKDIARKKKETKVITVFSAKGGVGKTTIATELATYLALISNGREKFRVCIVDYNIDFGDVVQTLNLDSEKARERACLTIWAEDVRERIRDGENPKKITFTKGEIERYLLQDNDSGLYALAAPISNDDSIGIDTVEMQIIIDNLIKNGDFDFIICDTGNNTRDSTTICLQRADLILMVVTQNINTINCNDSLINTLYKIDFDLSKFRIVVNKVKPEKAVKLSLDDAKTCIENPETGKPIECIAVINDSDSVRAANNEGKPLVYTPNSSFKNSMKDIASYIFGDEHVINDVEPKKLSLFARLFGKG